MVKVKRYLVLILIASVLLFTFIYYTNSVWNAQKEINKKVAFINLKLENKVVSFDKNGDFIKNGETSGLPEIKAEGKKFKKHYDAIKELSFVFPLIQDLLNRENFKLILDLEKDEILMEGNGFKALIGRKNIKRRIENVITLVHKEKVSGFIDASFDSMMVVEK